MQMKGVLVGFSFLSTSLLNSSSNSYLVLWQEVAVWPPKMFSSRIAYTLVWMGTKVFIHADSSSIYLSLLCLPHSSRTHLVRQVYTISNFWAVVKSHPSCSLFSFVSLFFRHRMQFGILNLGVSGAFAKAVQYSQLHTWNCILLKNIPCINASQKTKLQG